LTNTRALRNYGVAVASVALASAVRFVLDPLLEERSPFLVYLLAVLLTAAVCGARPALVATVLGALAGHWLFVAPRFSFLPADASELYHTLFYVVAGIAIAAGASALRTSRDRAAAHAAELANREAQFRIATDAARVSVWEWDVATGRLSWGGDHLRLAGFGEHEFDGTIDSFRRALHPDDRERVWAGVRAVAARQGLVWHDEYRFLHHDGSVRWAAGRGNLRYADGRLAGMVGATFDVTELRLATEQLRASEERYRLLTEVAPQIVWMADPEGTPYYVNRRWNEFTGASLDELRRRGWADFLPPPEREATMREWLARLQSGEPHEMEFRLLHCSGEYRHMLGRSNPVRDLDGRIVRWVGVATDIHALRRAEREAKERGEFLEVVLAATGLGTWDFHPDDHRLYWDARCKALFGLPPDAEVTQEGSFVAGLHPEDRAATLAAVAKSLAPDGTGNYDAEYRTIGHTDGIVRWVRATGRVFRGPGRETRFVGTVEDVGERKRREAERQQLLESERAARAQAEHASTLKDEFLATLSHELRTPLNAILGWATVLRRKADEPGTLAQAIDVIERNARVQNQLIADLLDMSRIVSGKLRLDVQRVDLPPLIEAAVESVRPAADARGVRVQCVLDRVSHPVHGDPARLQQVFWNLLSNAVKFTPRGGRVQVVMSRVGSHVEVAVSDTGIGMEAAFLPYAFERFRQADASAARQHGGLGLGLAIVKELAELHGGRVRAASGGSGQGSTFVVELPMAPVNSVAPATETDRAEAPGPEVTSTIALDGVRILVVDDEPDSRELVRRTLAERGAEVTVAGGAEEALAAIARDPFDVLVSDVGMPGTDGYALIAAVRREGHAVPALALTAFARSEDRTRALLAGYQLHLSKPAEEAELLASVAALAGRLRARPAAPAAG
jgi:PAS domain S-box-containing protein